MNWGGVIKLKLDGMLKIEIQLPMQEEIYSLIKPLSFNITIGMQRPKHLQLNNRIMKQNWNWFVLNLKFGGSDAYNWNWIDRKLIETWQKIDGYIKL